MSLLRRYQRQDVVPKFAQFIEEVNEVCKIKGQQGPRDQLITLLESVVAASEINQDIEAESMDLAQAGFCGFDLVIMHLMDHLLSKEEVNGLFQVITEMFYSIQAPGGKLLALDKVHKFMDVVKSNGPCETIADVDRSMRHDGMRPIVGTQSPKALTPELLEPVSVAVLHQFHSWDWWPHLKQKLPCQVTGDAWDQILSLRTGDVSAFASRLGFMIHQGMEGATMHLLRLVFAPEHGRLWRQQTNS
jgi:hypothetical protein